MMVKAVVMGHVWVVGVLFAVLLHGVFADVSRALLALDRSVEGDLVAGRNATVRYLVHNVGQSDATSVSLKDLSFPSSRFTVHSGSFRHTWPSLPAMGNVSMSVSITPKRAGHLLVSPASVSYEDEDGVKRTTKLAAADEVIVEDLLSFRRRTDTHRKEWSMYAVALLLLVVAPFGVSMSIESGVPKAAAGKKKL